MLNVGVGCWSGCDTNGSTDCCHPELWGGGKRGVRLDQEWVHSIHRSAENTIFWFFVVLYLEFLGIGSGCNEKLLAVKI